MKKFNRLVLVSVFVISIFFPSIAKAGVVTGELVEVDSEASKELDAYRVKLDECDSEKYRLELRSKDLDDKIAALAARMKALASDNDKLNTELAALKNENKILLAERIQKLEDTTKAETAAPAKKKAVVKSDDTCESHPVKSPLGVIVGTPVGTVAGAVRGAITKGVATSDTMQEKLGDNIASQFVSKTVGFVIGTIPGLLTGLVTGFIDGIKYGWCEPFTAKSISLEGDFVNDWDSYDKFRN